MTLAGSFGNHPPTDEAGFLAFARKLPTPDLYKLICRARPLTEIVQYKFSANQRRRYEQLADFPEGCWSSAMRSVASPRFARWRWPVGCWTRFSRLRSRR